MKDFGSVGDTVRLLSIEWVGIGASVLLAV